ncbi:alternative ribosome rescue aminoacyl-tRNA hydrolase ArfB [Spirochaeta isovalerica]|uniref:Ribosome-associated protein n=1 Tax=Spirochaeta isovalerica TaxID=150 RepID=A0A841R3Q7_9SPIO|nr:alternative ribosome rescue aminoacyl-tRNA hydrolase ArfB [Spirochaeta isovalerica]MBB6478433.1 ribosome-associated protein [Spirochaeta isovalerica]
MNRQLEQAIEEWLTENMDLSFSRSGGPGGQNVNKVNTKVTARVDVRAMDFLDERQVVMILLKLNNRINEEGILQIQVSDTRSQIKNREIALARLTALIEGSLHVAKKRRQTRPSRAAREKRLDNKRKISEKKSMRRNVDY